MAQVEYPDWVPEEYIEAEDIFEKAASLEVFDDEGIDAEFVIDGHVTDTIDWAHVSQYPRDEHDIEKVEIQFGNCDPGDYTLTITKMDGEIQSNTLHRLRYEDFKWVCDPDDLTIAGVDDSSSEDRHTEITLGDEVDDV